MPAWFYWLLSLCVALIAVLPHPSVFLLVSCIGWVVYFSCFANAPERTLLVFIVLLPTASLFGRETSFLPGLNLETVAIVTLAIAVTQSREHQPHRPSANPFTAPVLYYSIVLVVAASVAFFLGSGLGPRELFSSVKARVVTPWLAPLAFWLVADRGKTRTAVGLITIVTGLISLHTLWAYRGGIPTDESGAPIRPGGFMFDQPNLYGGFLALMVVILVSLTLSASSRWAERAFYAAGLIAATAALILTSSRGAWAGAVIGILVVGFQRGAKFTLLLLVLALTANFWIPKSVFERVGSTLKTSDSMYTEDVEIESSARVRFIQWNALPGWWLEAPLFGHGYGSFPQLYAPHDPQGRAMAAHSSIVELTVEEGLAGLVAYCWLVWTLGKYPWRVSRRSQDPFLRALAAGVAGAVVCLVVLDGSGTRFRSGNVMAYLWVLGGALARMALEPSLESPETGKKLTVPAP